jgi:hypothetical protein
MKAHCNPIEAIILQSIGYPEPSHSVVVETFGNNSISLPVYSIEEMEALIPDSIKRTDGWKILSAAKYTSTGIKDTYPSALYKILLKAKEREACNHKSIIS